MERIGFYSGSFDPVTNGHLDIIRRSLKVADRLIVAVAHNVAKSGTFSVEERMDILRSVLGDEPRIEITAFEGLLVEFCRTSGAGTVIHSISHASMASSSLACLYTEECHTTTARRRSIFGSGRRARAQTARGGRAEWPSRLDRFVV